MKARKTKVITVRVPEPLERVADLRSHEEHVDRATTLRKWIYEGAERYVLDLVQEGRISLAKAAELLDLTVYDIQRLAARHGVELGPTDDQLREAQGVLSRLLARSSGGEGGAGPERQRR